MIVRPVESELELEEILALQQLNLRGRVSAEEEREQGFVTVAHTSELLRKMHTFAPSIIAREGPALAGYALVMTQDARPLIPILEPMFAQLEDLTYRGHPIRDLRFYVMGQVCVAREARGRGVFDALYEGHRKFCADRFDLVVTEVATRNTRSMRAHERVGFEVIHTYRDATDDWAVIAWHLGARKPG